MQCWTASGEAIKLCGHGLLSCAATWQAQWGGPGVLNMNGLDVPFHQTRDIYWLGLPSAKPTAADVPGWTDHFFTARPESAAIEGDDSDYLILAWPDDFPLESLTVPDDSLIQHTGRSVIATCRVTENNRHWQEQVRYRYFAPQHGVREDPATGSAMRVLAAYWRTRGLSDSLKAHQCSSRGGVLYSILRGERTLLGGFVSPTEIAGNTRA